MWHILLGKVISTIIGQKLPIESNNLYCWANILFAPLFFLHEVKQKLGKARYHLPLWKKSFRFMDVQRRSQELWINIKLFYPTVG